MSGFQVIALSVLGAALLGALILFWRGSLPRRALAVRAVVLLAAGAAIANPDLVQALAQAIGIGRGADVVLYATTLALVALGFHVYLRNAELQRQITELVRHLALADARRGEPREPRPPQEEGERSGDGGPESE